MNVLRMARKRRIGAAAAIAGALVVLVPGTAYANGGNNTSTSTGTLSLTIAVTHATNCSDAIPGGWQCTPVAVVSAVPVYIGSRTPLVGGYLYWYGWATCQIREKSDGFDNNWTGWRSCSPSSKSASSTRSWTSTGQPVGGQHVFQWGQEINIDTWLAQDCIEVRMRVYGSGYVQERLDVTGTVLGTSPTASIYYPSSSGWNSETICE
jgi:hypothetical protein